MDIRVIKVPLEVTVWVEGKVSVAAIRNLLRGVKWEEEHVTAQGRAAADLPAPTLLQVREAVRHNKEVSND